MKKMIQKAVLAAVVAAIICTGTEVRAEVKLATVDLRKVFDNYYKTKQASEIFKKETEDVQKERKDMVDKFNKLEDEWKKLIERANDQAISADERDKSKQAAEKRLVELREMEQSVNDYDRIAQQKLMAKQKDKLDQLVNEIRQVVNTKCKNAGYTMVLDVSGETMNKTPVVLYTDGQNDVTDMILKELNATAPAPKADAKPETKPGSEPLKLP